jgi:hypothetical protein
MDVLQENEDCTQDGEAAAAQDIAPLEEVARQLKEMADYLAYLATQPLRVLSETSPLHGSTDRWPSSV